METIDTQSTSARTAECSPIVLREKAQVRLIFIPTIVDNLKEPLASVRGTFLYQRKSRKDEWENANTLSLASVKSGEAYQLELDSEEVLKLRKGLYELAQLHREHGIPSGHRQFVRMRSGLAQFLKLGQPDLQELFDEHPSDALDALVKILQWASRSPDLADAAQRLATVPASELPNITSLLSLASMKAALAEWESNSSNPSEDYWQSLLSRHAGVLSQLFAFPVVVIQEKAYVGGKRLNRRGGKEVDFLAKAAATGGLLLIEIKAPTTRLLGGLYRGVHPLSSDVNGAVAQILHYRQSLMKEFTGIAEDAEALTLGDPKCIVISGNAASELTDSESRNSFELLRERMGGVTVVTFDELFERTRRSLGLMEETTSG